MKVFVFWTGVVSLLSGAGLQISSLSVLLIPAAQPGMMSHVFGLMAMFIGATLVLCSRNLHRRGPIVAWVRSTSTGRIHRHDRLWRVWRRWNVNGPGRSVGPRRRLDLSDRPATAFGHTAAHHNSRSERDCVFRLMPCQNQFPWRFIDYVALDGS